MFFTVRLAFLILICWATFNLTREQEMLNKIENVFENIEKSQLKLKNLVKQLVSSSSTPTASELSSYIAKEDDCLCVPYYLCNVNGTIITDGTNLIRERMGNPCKNIDICCQMEYIKDPLKAPRNYKCGYGSDLPQDSQPVPTNAKFGEFPWTVLIFNSSKYYTCVGSLIHPKVILTAAHCVNLSNSYSVLAGAWNISAANPDHPSERSRVDRVIKHPEFTSNNLFYDAALLILQDAFNLTETIKTTCLVTTPKEKIQINSCRVSGWGKSSPTGYFSRVMKKIELTLLTHQQCETSLKHSRLGKWFELHHSFLCAYGIIDEVCDGDGGGPLVCRFDGEDRYEQVGVASWGISCGSEFPSVFSKVSYIKNWIDGHFESLGYDKQYYSL